MEHLPALRKLVTENASRFTVQQSQAIDISMLSDMIKTTGTSGSASSNLFSPSKEESDEEFAFADSTENAAEEEEVEEVMTEVAKFSLQQLEGEEQRRLAEVPTAHNRVMRSYPDLKPEVLDELKPFLGRDKDKMSPEEWKQTVAKYYKEPVTALDKDRDEFFRSMDPAEVEEAEGEAELYAFQRVRTENEVILRARLQLQYDQKEAARRFAEYKRRRLPGMVKEVEEGEDGKTRRKREKIPFEHRPSIKLNYPKRLR